KLSSWQGRARGPMRRATPPGQEPEPIRQVAALPYRIEGQAPDARVRVMLITTRGSKARWVLPKGNPGSLSSLHVAAALEAQEEAGVPGAVCPVPLGSYRYANRQGSGASLMIDVDVYSLAITDELESWKEQDERERRWFSLDESSKAVDEEDLGNLIPSFGFSEFQSSVNRSGLGTVVSEKTKGLSAMFAWFQRLLP